MNYKTFTSVVAVILIILFLVWLICSNTIFKESNPISVLYGIVRLNAANNKIQKISDNPEKYIVKEGQYNSFIDLMKSEGWTYKNRLGAGFIFQKGEESLIATTKVYNNKYEVIKVIRNFRNLVIN